MSRSPAVDLLAELRGRGVALRVVGDRLRYRPVAAVTPELRERMAACKAELIDLLQPAPSPAGAAAAEEEAAIPEFGDGDRPSVERCPGCGELDFVRPRPRGTWCCARCHPYEGYAASDLEWWPRVGIAVAFEAGGSAAGEPCRCCGGAARWRLRSGGPWVCSTCHPPLPPPDLIETEAGR